MSNALRRWSEQNELRQKSVARKDIVNLESLGVGGTVKQREHFLSCTYTCAFYQRVFTACTPNIGGPSPERRDCSTSEGAEEEEGCTRPFVGVWKAKI